MAEQRLRLDDLDVRDLISVTRESAARVPEMWGAAGPDLADLLEEAIDENERLRDALERIASWKVDDLPRSLIARDALMAVAREERSGGEGREDG